MSCGGAPSFSMAGKARIGRVGIQVIPNNPVSSPSVSQDEGYSYKVKVIHPKKKEWVVRQIHHFHAKFKSITHLKSIISDEVEEEVSDAGYLEGRQDVKRWLVSQDDLSSMYAKFTAGDETSLWCSVDHHENTAPTKRRSAPSQSVAASSSRQAKEDELESIFKELKGKHEDKYSVPQLRLWARMISCGTHDDVDDPPRVPLIVGSPLPKRQKQESLTTALVDAATAFAHVISPKTNPQNPSSPATTPSVPRTGVSPGRKTDIRMKSLEQLRYIQNLFDDKILSQEEFIEQKRAIMDTLRQP